MAYPTFRSCVNEVITLMGQVNGSGVQAYTEPQVQIAINRIFDYLWDKRKWEQLWGWTTGTIAADGRLTEEIENVRIWSDIGEIRDANTRRGIVRPVSTEHLYVTGSTPLYYTVLPWDDDESETKFFKFWPVGATGPVEILCGFRPDEFAGDDDIIPMDRSLIIYGAVWFMLADDGINPASADKFQGLFDLAYQSIVDRLNSVPIGHGSGRRNGQTVYIQS